MINLLIADSNQLCRCGLTSIFSQYDDIQLVGEASSSGQLMEMVDSFNPDIVLLDFTAAQFSIDDIPQILRTPGTRVVAITPEQSAKVLVSALQAGVTGYIKKDCDIGEIVGSVQEASRGGKFFCGQILETIREQAIDLEDLNLGELSCEPVNISARESEIIKLIAEGNTNSQVADKLFISSHTVNTHRKNIMQKLGVNNAAAIVMYAVKTGLVSPNHFLFAPNE